MKVIRLMRIPFFTTACQVTVETETTEDNMDAVAAWCGGHVIRDTENPFVQVPVDRPTNRRQTEATVGSWVVRSVNRGRASFKVYPDEWLGSTFVVIPDEVVTSMVAGLDTPQTVTIPEQRSPQDSGPQTRQHGGEPTNNVRPLQPSSGGRVVKGHFRAGSGN